MAETGQQDVLTRAEISVALVAADRRLADSVLDKADRMIEDEGRAPRGAGARRDFHSSGSPDGHPSDSPD